MSEQPRYPEKAHRESMLWDVYEWFQEQTDPQPRLWYHEVASMGIPLATDRETETGTEVDVVAVERQSSQAINRFVRLVDEGYINAQLQKGVLGGPAFSSALVRGLTEKGLIEIGELPDPTERLVLGLDAAIRVIQRDPTLDEEERRRRIDWFEEAKFVVRTLGVETVKAIWRGDLPAM
jgi:hypothetical protein